MVPQIPTSWLCTTYFWSQSQLNICSLLHKQVQLGRCFRVITLWQIWCSRCARVLKERPCTKVLIYGRRLSSPFVGSEVHVPGPLRAAHERLISFMKTWGCSLTFHLMPLGMSWNYRSAPWLFSHIVEARDRVFTLPPVIKLVLNGMYYYFLSFF